MAVAVKGPLKDGNRCDLLIAQIQVSGEFHGDALGPGVPGALLGKLDKILHAGMVTVSAAAAAGRARVQSRASAVRKAAPRRSCFMMDGPPVPVPVPVFGACSQ